jgi:hypothetical protein
MPTLCRCLAGTAIDTLRNYRHTRTVMHSDPRRHQRLACPWPRIRTRSPSKTSGMAIPTSTVNAKPSPLGQPTLPISLGSDTAGSFLGDCRTPSGVRNSSRIRSFDASWRMTVHGGHRGRPNRLTAAAGGNQTQVAAPSPAALRPSPTFWTRSPLPKPDIHRQGRLNLAHEGQGGVRMWRVAPFRLEAPREHARPHA